MLELLGTGNCGVKELDGIEDAPAEIVMDLAELMFRRKNKMAFAVFSDNTKAPRYGQRLASFIVKHNLGEVTTQRARKNPNSGRNIKVWLWGIDRGAFEKWYNSQVSV